MSTKINSFVVADPAKCIGCKVCEVACAVAHTNYGVVTAGTMEDPVIPRLYLVKTAEVTMPVQCRHCEDAPCANVCPVGAISQENNVIVVNEADCVGCKTCMMACPFGAMDLVPKYVKGEEVTQRVLKSETEDGLVEKAVAFASKCDLCISRPDGPACVENCPEQALEIVKPAALKKERNRDAALSLLESVKKFME